MCKHYSSALRTCLNEVNTHRLHRNTPESRIWCDFINRFYSAKLCIRTLLELPLLLSLPTETAGRKGSRKCSSPSSFPTSFPTVVDDADFRSSFFSVMTDEETEDKEQWERVTLTGAAGDAEDVTDDEQVELDLAGESATSFFPLLAVMAVSIESRRSFQDPFRFDRPSLSGRGLGDDGFAISEQSIDATSIILKGTGRRWKDPMS